MWGTGSESVIAYRRFVTYTHTHAHTHTHTFSHLLIRSLCFFFFVIFGEKKKMLKFFALVDKFLWWWDKINMKPDRKESRRKWKFIP